MARIYIIMGVSGSGKTTIGKLLADRLQIPYFDADAYHPETNIMKMSDGIALQDKDRIPWLNNLRDEIIKWNTKSGAVLACSALKEFYREILQPSNVKINWIVLNGSFELIFKRMKQRQDHYMSAEMLKSQFDVLEIPDYGLHLNIYEKPDKLLELIIDDIESRKLPQFGIIGLGVMGENLAMNLVNKGYPIAVYNRSSGEEKDVVKTFLKKHNSSKTISGYEDLKSFIQALKKPRKILMMIKSGPAVDDVIEEFLPYLDEGDVIIDGGNSHFKDTARRIGNLKLHHIHFLGVGISGGAKGALEGPSIMPGGDYKAFLEVADILNAIAAKDQNDTPCCTYIGPGGSGHYVKMVHNGIEYVEMQLLAEIYDLLLGSYSNDEIATLFKKWSESSLSSYLLDITAEILAKKENGQSVLDIILDRAEHKGTGIWSSINGLELGVPVTMMNTAVFSRMLSSMKTIRSSHSDKLNTADYSGIKPDVESLKQTYALARLINHHQGFELIREASLQFEWNLNCAEIARIWTNGCIIRSDLMNSCSEVFRKVDSLLEDKSIFEKIVDQETTFKALFLTALSERKAIPCFSAAYNYWIMITSKQLPANLIQAQRDYFGAHTYQRTDAPLHKFFHTNW